MTVNHSSVLSVKYFESYFKLVILSRNYDIEKAKEFVVQNFFKGNQMLYGVDTYQSFRSAYSKLLKKEK
ncbi:hypothetical protein [Fredinandcohnia quinoae]|uniref:LAGLIDADG homing endonuclease n=1 Tax=Fredinandcohnia quinoae TaxID=2918902 RepID=A0AAW5E514_9BACI|nr:hypothetical protein [Fredinandcohnia sp. SECRCQ15]MCH1627433.1 hypothetical protein [Fredinandcohnia sp. SECRCQ15]